MRQHDRNGMVDDMGLENGTYHSDHGPDPGVMPARPYPAGTLV
jgi:hypothetical protein